MKRNALTLLFISCVIFSMAQNRVGVKIYQNTDVFGVRYRSSPGGYTNLSLTNFNRISLAVDLETKKNYKHEIEFFIPEISKSIDRVQFPFNYEFRKGQGYDSRVSTYALRYEVSRLITSTDTRFSFLLGAGLNPYYILAEYEPYTAMTYYASEKTTGISVNVTPRVQYKFNKSFSADVSLPLKIYDLHNEKTSIKNPAIPVRQQTTEDKTSTFFENVYTVRLGFMYTLPG